MDELTGFLEEIASQGPHEGTQTEWIERLKAKAQALIDSGNGNMGKWLPVTEDSPGTGYSVLGWGPTLDPDDVRKVFRTSRGFFDAFECGCGCSWNITQWQPLPEAPK